MTMNLNRMDTDEAGRLWETDNYELRIADDLGYVIVNKITKAVEGKIDQEPAGVLTILLLQESYDEIMVDPVREYEVRKQKQESRPKMALLQ